MYFTSYYHILGGEADEVIRNGEADIIFGSPEMIIGSKHWREELEKFNVKLIVVDEFHTVATWYVIKVLAYQCLSYHF